MPLDNDLPFREAVHAWWDAKGANKAAIGKSQGGSRDGNLRGDTMDGFRDAIRARLIAAGISDNDIFSAPQISGLPSNLPSYFRATKNWDLVVCKDSLFKRGDGATPTLLAALEFKSQHGSIGNNQNNRIEESVGTATDFWAAYEQGAFLKLLPRPWLGYLFVGVYEDSDFSKPVEIKQPHLPADDVFAGEGRSTPRDVTKFEGVSYANRYRIGLTRMIAKKLYDGACFIVTNESIRGQPENFLEPFPELGVNALLDGLVRHVRAHYDSR